MTSPTDPESSWRPSMPGYFDNVWRSYRKAIDANQYSVAIDRGLELFESYRAADPATYSTEHKGSPMYALGYAAYASHDYPSASLFFDAAVAEDIRKFGVGADKPALLFMRLEDKDQQVLASKIILDIIQVVQHLIGNYCARPGHIPINLDEVRTHFLKPLIASPDAHKRSLITAFISFIAEWRYRARQIGLVEGGSREPFFLHLFRGCLLFESLLKESGRRTTSGLPVLSRMLRLYENELGIVAASIDQSSTDIDRKIRAATSNMAMQQTIEITNQLRNTFGHNIVWEVPALNAGSYNILVENIASACLHTVSTLYR